MASDEDQSRKDFLEACERLHRNDPSQTSLRVDHEDGMLSDTDTHQQLETVAGALNQPRLFLEDLHICVQGVDPFLLGLLPHVIRTSTSLKKMNLQSALHHPRPGGHGTYFYECATDALLTAAAHCESLRKLTLDSIPFVNLRMLGYFLKHTSISELNVDFGHQRLRADQAEMICHALQQNASLQKLVLDQTTPALLGWILPGIHDHCNLRELQIVLRNDIGSAWNALPELLSENHIIQDLKITMYMGLSYNPAPLLTALQENSTLKKLTVSIQYLDNSDDTMPEEAAPVWRDMLQGNKGLKEFEWRDSTILAETATAIATGLAGNTTVKCFRLVDCTLYLPDSDVSWSVMLQQNKTLTVLQLSVCGIGPSEVEFLAAGLSLNSSLMELNLSDNEMACDGFRTLADSLQRNKTLQILRVNNNDIEGLDASNALRDLLLHNETLQLIDLSDNDIIGYTGGPMVAEGIARNSGLEELNLSRNRFNSQSTEGIFEALRHNRTMLRLILHDVAIPGNDSATLLRETFQASMLQTIDLGSNPLGEQDIEMLAQGLRDNRILRRLYLQGLGLCNESLLLIGEALTVNTTLEFLDVKEGYSFYQRSIIRNRLDEVGIRAFVRLLPRMHGLKELRGLSITDEETASILAESLRENTVMEVFSEVNIEGSPSRRLVNFYLEMNKRGRKLLHVRDGATIPVGLWALVLAKLSPRQHNRFMYCLLQHKPELVSTQATADA
jgi:Ran GTPase-activating protein (RanGAP) involved in mRNA processing and transport